jgi:hypothetical protein
MRSGQNANLKEASVRKLLTLFGIFLFAIACAAQRPAAQSVPQTLVSIPAELENKDALDRFLKNTGDDWTVGYTKDRKSIKALTGRAPAIEGSQEDRAEALLKETTDLKGLSRETFKRDALRQVGKLQQYRYQQYVGDTPIENASILITFNEVSKTVNIIPNTVVLPEAGGELRSPREAERIAIRALETDLKTEKNAQALLEGATELKISVVGETPKVPSLLKARDRVYRVYRVTVQGETRRPEGKMLVALRDYAVDATKNEKNEADLIIEIRNRIHRLVTGNARIFNLSPRDAGGAMLLPLRVPNSEPPYQTVEISINNAVNGRFALVGPSANVTNIDDPPTPPPTVPAGADGRPNFSVFRGGAGFAAGMAYFHIATMQRYLEEIGFPSLCTKPMRADVDAGLIRHQMNSAYRDDPAGGFLIFSHYQSIFMAEDGEVIAHEFGHAVLAGCGNGRFNNVRSKLFPDSEAGPINEGFADYWAMSTFSDEKRRQGVTLDCFAQWVGGGTCLRQFLGNPTHDRFNPNALNEENGKIWSGVLFDIFQTLGGNRRVVDPLILDGHMLRADAGDAPTMEQIAGGILLADGGANTDTLCRLFARHALSPPECPPRS